MGYIQEINSAIKSFFFLVQVSLILFFNIQFSIFNLEYYGLYISTKLLVVPSIVTGLLCWFPAFVQGGNSLLFTLGRNDEERALLVNSTGRKWGLLLPPCHFRRRFFASFPVVLQYQLWQCLLVVDDCSFQFRIANCFLRVPVQAGQSAGKHTLPMVSGYKWYCRTSIAGRCGSHILYRLQFPS